MRFLPRIGLVLLLASWLAACTVVGPNFTPPEAPVASTYQGANNDFKPAAGPVAVVNQAPDWHWWAQFHDPELDGLEARAVAGNLDLQVALLRIVEARSQVQIARAQGVPSLSASASANREQLGLAGILKSTGANSQLNSSSQASGLISELTQPVDLYQIGFDSSWELDLFGKVTRSVEAAKAQSDAAVESRNDALVSLEAEVAQTYFQLRAAQMLRDITLQLLSDQREVLALTENRYFSGLSNQSTVEAIKAQLASAESQLPGYDQTIATHGHALAVLLGLPPTALEAELQTSVDLPALPAAVPVGLPSSLVRRRPDVRQAEATLHAATAEIGVSMAALFPDVTLSGTFGLRNVSTQYLFNWASHFYTIGPSVSLPIFQGGTLTANLRVSKAQAAEAALNYRKTVLSALQEVEDGLTTLHDDGLRVGALQESLAADQRSDELANDGYQAGLQSDIDVLNAALQTAQAKVQLDSAVLTESTDLVKLYKALGGGWQTTEDPPDRVAPAVGTLGGVEGTSAEPADAPGTH